MKIRKILTVPLYILILMLLFNFNESPAQTQQAIRINCGSWFPVEVGGFKFSEDKYYTGTFVYSNMNIADIANTEYDILYKTERTSNTDLGTFQYKIPVLNGPYTVVLHFAEIYFGATGGDSTGGVGRRIFNVDIEGQNVISNYDLYAAVGPMYAVQQSFQVNVADDTLNIFFSATVNRGKISAIEVLPPGDIPLSVKLDNLKREKATSYSLSQNFPNPFNPTTKIRFSLPEAGNVKLTVYNLIGQTVATLINGYQEAGSYNVTFDGSGLNSGIYFYKLETGKYVEIKKMALLK